jgi:predicted Zn-dependent peptidase
MPRRDSSLAPFQLAKLTSEKRRLANGLPVVICPRPGLSWAYAAVYFGIGSRHEAPAQNGLTHVLEHMLFRGTRSFRDATTLNAAAEDLGGYLEGATYRDHLVFSTGCHPSAVAEAIAILGEIVQWPRYRGMKVEREILHEELLETLDRDGRMIDLDNVTHAAIFRQHGLGLPIEGNLANLERFDKSTIEAHRRRYLVARNAVVSVAGPIDPDVVARAVRDAFGTMPEGEPPEVTPAPRPFGKPVLRYIRHTNSQVDLRLSFWAVPIRDPDYPPLVLLARLLADGLASRLHAELVDRQGLAYSLHAGLASYRDCGLFEFEITVAPDRAADAIHKLLDFSTEAKRMRFTGEELARTLRRYRYGMEFMADDASDLASWHGRAALFDMESQITTLYDRLTELEHRDLHRVARRFFTPERLVITAVGELARGESRRMREVVERWSKTAAPSTSRKLG